MTRIRLFFRSRYSVPILLFWLSTAGYLLLVNRLGFYWDDWAIAWIAEKLGSAGVARYYATNRFFWGLIYQVTTRLIANVPWQWQLFGLLWRWLCCLSLWWTLRQVWKDHPEAAAWISFLFAVYPGFSSQPIAINYGHFFIVLTAFFLSLGLMIRNATTNPNPVIRSRQSIITLLAIFLSLTNLLCMEYFFFLDALRPILLWIAFTPQEPNYRQRLRRTIINYLPYLAVFLGVIIWRALLFRPEQGNFQADNYQMVLLQHLKEQPVPALLGLFNTILTDLWTTTAAAWGQALSLPDASLFGYRTLLAYFGLALVTATLAGLYLTTQFTQTPAESEQPNSIPLPYTSLIGKYSICRRFVHYLSGFGWGWQAISLGLIALLCAGWPFWLTALPVGLTFPNDRFTFPFMLGASLLIAGLIRCIPGRPLYRGILLVILLAVGVGREFQVANLFARDWGMQKAFFWQMSWRMPGLKTGTTLLANDWKQRYYSDNSLTAPVNWIYAPNNRSEEMSFMFYFPVVRLGYGLPKLQKDLPIEQNYLAAHFQGNTSQAIALYFGQDACLRVLDPNLDTEHWSITPLMRQAALMSNPVAALQADTPQPLPVELFGSEPPRSWCYYFEKADLARQQSDWQQVATLGDQAFALSDHPNDPIERAVFIEGYAQTGQWERSIKLTNEAAQLTPLMQPVLCQLWQRIDRQTVASSEKQRTISQVQKAINCYP